MTNVIKAVFPWRGWTAQPCLVCHVPLDIAAPDVIAEVYEGGKPLGYRHDSCEMPKEGIEDAV